MAPQKRLFQYEKSAWTKFANRFHLQLRIYLGIGVLLFYSSSGIIWQGLSNGERIKVRSRWLQDRVRDPNAEEFVKLDIEIPPITIDILPNATKVTSKTEK